MPSEASTADDSDILSDDAYAPAVGSDNDEHSPAFRIGCYDDHQSGDADAKAAHPIVLNLEECLAANIPKEASASTQRSKLSSAARTFQPITAVVGRGPVSEDIHMVVMAAVTALKVDKRISCVSLNEGALGEMTTIVANVRSNVQEDGLSLAPVKTALLQAAERTQSAYILGYSTRPFKDISALSFKTWIALLPIEHQDIACWESFEKGFCPRGGSCCWCHPHRSSMVQLTVTLNVTGLVG